MGIVDAHKTDTRKRRRNHLRSRYAPPGSKPPRHYMPQPDDIVFTNTDVRWVHHPYEDALVITAVVATCLVHRLLVDNESIVDILY